MTVELKRDLELVGQEIKVRGEKIKQSQEILKSDPKWVALKKQIKDHKIARDICIVEAHKRIVDDKEQIDDENFQEWCWRFGVARQYAHKIVQKHYLQLGFGHQDESDDQEDDVDCDIGENHPLALPSPEVRQSPVDNTMKQIASSFRSDETLALFGAMSQEVKRLGYRDEAVMRFIEPMFYAHDKVPLVQRLVTRMDDRQLIAHANWVTAQLRSRGLIKKDAK